MESLKNIIASVLDNSESLCLDSSEDKQTLLDSIMEALKLDDLTVIQMIEQSGADVQQDYEGQYIVYTGVYQEDQLSVITLIVLSYGLYVAVELVRRVQLLCEKYTQAISLQYSGGYNMFYFCTLSRAMVWDVLEWDKVGELIVTGKP